MDNSEQIQKDKERWMAAAHAMQSGVAMKMAFDKTATDPKHLRVGVNTAMTDHGSLVALLITKGLFSEAEYIAAIADGMEAEKLSYEKELSELYGSTVTLA